jgi:hypothetical protein
METTSEIIAAVGKPRIKAAFGIGDRTLQLCIKNNGFPASWFDMLERMTGQTLDRRLFSFKGDVK